MPRLTFFIGKGGVGKTTVSSAYALLKARKRPRQSILLLSTDPAHSLADVLQVKLGDRPKRLLSAGRLWARQLDAGTQIKSFLGFEREDILGLLSRGSLFTRDEIEPLLDTTLPGMAEVAALLAIQDLLDSDFDEVVIDTAPMGHALRLFQMPRHFARLLKLLEAAAVRDEVLARHFGGRVAPEPVLDRWSRMIERVHHAFSPEAATLVLVTTPEPFSLNESVRSELVLEDSGSWNWIVKVVLNRVVTRRSRCAHCQRLAHQSRVAYDFLKKHFADAKVFTAEDSGWPILGLASLRHFGSHVWEGRRMRSVVNPPQAAPVKLQPASWPLLLTPLTLTIGKGGVGKTTVSAALAYHHRSQLKDEPVAVCSIDPAPSLDDVFGARVGDILRPVLGDRKLRAAELDAPAQFQQWSGKMRGRLNQALAGDQQGVHVDLSLDRNFLLSLLDVVPPGVDEIFAVFRVLELLETGHRVVIDMAPTGHALEVLRTPTRLLAWAGALLKTLARHRTLPLARDAAVEVAKLSRQMRDLAALLRDRKRCSVIVVTLPEPLPDYETRRLVRLAHGVDAPVAAVFINRVLVESSTKCLRCRYSSQWQAVSMASLRRRLRGAEGYVTREFDAPIAGRRALQGFTQEIWRLA